MSGSWQRHGDAGDVAVMLLEEAVSIEPCSFAALNSLEPVDAADGGAHELYAQGFPHGYAMDGTHVTLRTSSARLLRQEWLEVDVDEGHLQRLDKGFSGSAVYRPTTREVVGMVTDAVLDSGHIGKMLPLDRIRRYWEPLDDLLPLSWLVAEPRRELRSLLHEATTSEPISQIFSRAFPTFLRVPDNLRSVWDVVRYVGEEMTDPDRLYRLLLAIDGSLEDAAVRKDLRAWMRQWLTDSTQGREAEAQAPETSIIIRVEPTTKGAYELTMSTLLNGLPGRPMVQVATTAERIRHEVEMRLPNLLEAVLGEDWMIEFVVPRSLMQEPFEEWLIRESGTDTAKPRPLRSWPLVVRHVDRTRPLAVTDLTRRRWRTLRARGAVCPVMVDCRWPYAYEEFYNLLDANEEWCALIYGCRPGDDWLDAALNAGIPVMLWCRSQCPSSTGQVCADSPVRDGLAAAVSEDHPNELPHKVMRLRKEAKSPLAEAYHCGNHLTLFWDDPQRSPDPPLAMGRA
jgi:hypothetical protein